MLQLQLSFIAAAHQLQQCINLAWSADHDARAAGGKDQSIGSLPGV